MEKILSELKDKLDKLNLAKEDIDNILGIIELKVDLNMGRAIDKIDASMKSHTKEHQIQMRNMARMHKKQIDCLEKQFNSLRLSLSIIISVGMTILSIIIKYLSK